MGMMLARHRAVDGELELKRLDARLEAVKGEEVALKDEAKALSKKKAEIEKAMKAKIEEKAKEVVKEKVVEEPVKAKSKKGK